MSEKYKFEAQKKKLQGICDENNLVFRFRGDQYPATLTIRPTGGMGAQLSMLETADETGYISPDAYIRFSYDGGDLEYDMAEKFAISDVLLSKIKNIFRKMYSFWTGFFFKEIIENGILSGDQLPTIADEDDGSDIINEAYNEMEPLETFEDDEDDDAGEEDEDGYEYDEPAVSDDEA